MPADKTIILTPLSVSPLVMPADWNPLKNIVRLYGASGTGADGQGTGGVGYAGGGGGGGGFARKNNYNILPGQSITFSCPTTGAVTEFNSTGVNGAAPIIADYGRNAPDSLSFAGIGGARGDIGGCSGYDIAHDGGTGGTGGQFQQGGGGGGGCGGDGGDGGNGYNFNGSIGGTGGDSGDGRPGGTGGNFATLSDDGSDGLNGISAMMPDGSGAGGGCGGGFTHGAGPAQGGAGGDGGSCGGGGGGGGYGDDADGGAGGASAQSKIVLQYTPVGCCTTPPLTVPCCVSPVPTLMNVGYTGASGGPLPNPIPCTYDPDDGLWKYCGYAPNAVCNYQGFTQEGYTYYGVILTCNPNTSLFTLMSAYGGFTYALTTTCSPFELTGSGPFTIGGSWGYSLLPPDQMCDNSSSICNTTYATITVTSITPGP